MALVEFTAVDGCLVGDDTALLAEIGCEEYELYQADCPICGHTNLGKRVGSDGIVGVPANFYYDGSCEHFYPKESSYSEYMIVFTFGKVI